VFVEIATLVSLIAVLVRYRMRGSGLRRVPAVVRAAKTE
jgi:hypothetical protein